MQKFARSAGAFFLCFCLCVSLGSAYAAAALDLTGQTFDGLPALMTAINEAGAPKTVDLTGVPMELEDRRALMAAFPDTSFEWIVDVYGLKVSSQEAYIDIGTKNVKSLDVLMDYLDCLPNIRRVDMYYRTVPQEYIPELSRRHPDIRFNYLVKFAGYHVRTEVSAFSTLKDGSPPYIKSEEFAPLKYLPDLQALDLGHNAITDLSFLYDLPNLKVLILAVNKITDITPIGSLKDLEYLELFMNDITDLSPLEGLDKLLDLNLCLNDVEDITPLLGLTSLERLWISRNKRLSDASKEQLRQALPNTEINFTTQMSTQGGWRTHPRYKVIRRMFYRRVYFPFE